MTDWHLGLQAFREGRVREAADRLQDALAENELATSQTVRYETYAYLGAALYALGRPAEAVPAFEMAFRFSPAPVPPDDLTLNLAHAYLAAGRRAAAREALLFLLAHSPGHVAAGMLLARLEDAPSNESLSGSVLGASPQTAEAYIRTLTFSQPASGGYAPAEVHEALRQLQRLITSLSQELRQVEAQNTEYELEILRYRQMEDAVVETMMQTQAGPQDQASSNQQRVSTPTDTSDAKLSPIEILFRQKS